MDRWEEHKQRRNQLNNEYSSLCLQWRFLQGVRIALVIGYLAMVAAFYGIYRTAWLSFSAQHSAIAYSTQIALFESVIMLATPLIAFFATHFAERTEEVLNRMIGVVTTRGQQIERTLGIENGMFSDVGLGISVRQPLANTLPQMMAVAASTIYVLLIIVVCGTMLTVVYNLRLE